MNYVIEKLEKDLQDKEDLINTYKNCIEQNKETNKKFESYLPGVEKEKAQLKEVLNLIRNNYAEA